METKGRLQNTREMGAWPDKERDRKKKGQLNNVQVTLWIRKLIKRIFLHLDQRLVFVSFVFVFVFVIASIYVDCSVDLIDICA